MEACGTQKEKSCSVCYHRLLHVLATPTHESSVNRLQHVTLRAVYFQNHGVASLYIFTKLKIVGRRSPAHLASQGLDSMPCVRSADTLLMEQQLVLTRQLALGMKLRALADSCHELQMENNKNTVAALNVLARVEQREQHKQKCKEARASKKQRTAVASNDPPPKAHALQVDKQGSNDSDACHKVPAQVQGGSADILSTDGHGVSKVQTEPATNMMNLGSE